MVAVTPCIQGYTLHFQLRVKYLVGCWGEEEEDTSLWLLPAYVTDICTAVLA